MVIDMRTAREQREADTVLAKRTMMENLKMQQGRKQRAIIRIERSFLWSRPADAVTCLHLSSSYSTDTGPVPV